MTRTSCVASTGSGSYTTARDRRRSDRSSGFGRARLGAIGKCAVTHAHHLRAMGTAEDPVLGLYAVPDDHAVAVLAARGERMDRALEAVEHMHRVAHRDLEPLVVL